MWQKTLIKYLPHFLVLVALVALGTWGYHSIKQSGFREGAASVQLQWDEDTAKYLAEIERLKNSYAEKEAEHRAENQRITHELSQANQKHAVEIASLQSDLAKRMQLNTQRTAIYQRQAEAGAAECRDLASHAGRLDAALEEGRSLEREYRSTLGLRDRQIQALSSQIRNDRSLMEN
ncbi:putative Rz/Rxl spanin protein [Xanthomonas phage RiverRider]|uniref:Rz/Rxl spanin protein n=1 Tax=Xanthomonas phage RiverRider TaxID=2108116 RepID=A0A2P1JUZ0_9CAUD|nr:Rz-like spanin [Xanthomonas phage RiverRider]AVO23161.1 putative Rz/Rxl spanin protein [Xanthomonas phage RiverRider]